MITKSTPSSANACTAAMKFMCLRRGATHLFGGSPIVIRRRVLRGIGAADQQGQIDAEFLGRFDAAHDGVRRRSGAGKPILRRGALS
jgi:hypothetical protein